MDMTNSSPCPSALRPAPYRDFISKERNAETGLDWFDIRYFSSAQRRFTSLDSSIIIFEMLKGRNAQERHSIIPLFVHRIDEG
jgi:hypothetical protein